MERVLLKTYFKFIANQTSLLLKERLGESLCRNLDYFKIFNSFFKPTQSHFLSPFLIKSFLVLVLGLGLVLEGKAQCVQTQVFTSNGAFPVPSGVTSITIEAWGGGGRGGRRTTTGNSGGGGGGAYSRSVISVIPGQSYSFVVGAGSSTTSAGGTSRFYLNSGSDLVRALGGNSSGENSGLGATGGLASEGVGDVRYSGGKGADGGSNGGGGGSSSGSGSNGNNASGTNGAVPPIDGGRGGDGAVEDNGGNGQVPGGGGGGGRRYFVFIFPVTLTSGNGADGQIRITYTVSAGTLSGNQAVCVGGNTTFSSTVSGGIWSSNSGVATIHPTTGVITGVSPGTATITYIIPGIGICPNMTVSRTVTVTAPRTAGALSGNQAVCIGGNSTFTSTISGGTWSSNNTAVATVNPTTGVVTGVTAGTATITYTVPGTGGCTNASTTRSVTVTAAPSAGAISGIQTICTGGTSTFSSTISGGTWSSSNPSVATINSSTGVITGLAAGTSIITYTVAGTGGCANATATRTITVNQTPTLSSSLTSTRCSNIPGTYTATSATGGTTFSWTRAAVPGISNAAASGTTAAATETLINTTANPINVVYAYILTANGCSSTQNVTVTVNPTPTLNSPLTTTRCNNVPGTYTATSATPGTTFAWTRTAVSGISNAVGSGSTAAATETLINTTTNPINVVYSYTLTANGCSNTQNVTITVDPTTVITTQPSTASYEVCFGDGFNPISVAATGTNLTYQWYRNSTNSNTGGTLINGATSSSFTPFSTPVGVNYYYALVKGACGEVTSQFSGRYEVTPPVTTFTTNLDNTPQTICAGESFSSISVVATGANLSYQWYRNTTASNSGGTSIPNETSASFTPPSNVFGPVYYYAVASSDCGTVPSTVSGAFAITNATSAAPNQTVCINEPLSPAITHTTTGATGIGTASGLPPGVSASWANGVITISGTPTSQTGNPFNYSIPLIGGCGTVVATGTITVNPKSAISPMTRAVCSGDTFAFTPVNGTNGVVLPGTTYTWSAPSVTGGLTGGMAGNGTSISGSLNNPTNIPQTATYTVTPTSSANCAGPPFTLTVTVNPKPAIPAQTTAACSGAAFTVSPVNGSGSIVPTNTRYRWTVADNPNVTGETNQTTLQSSISQTLTNSTNVPQTVVYTVTPTSGAAGNCVGSPFTVTVTVNPRPVVSPITTTSCSGDALSVMPANEANGIVPAGTTYTWTVTDNTNVSGETNQTIPQGNISQTLTNNTLSVQSVVYSVTPRTGSCTGAPFNVTVNVNPTPVVNTVADQSLCNDSNTTAVNFSGNSVAGITYNWTNNTPSIGLPASGTGNIPSFTARNSGSSPITATITVTPVANGCPGLPKTFTITVNPTPVITIIPAYCTPTGSVELTAISNVSGTTWSWNTSPVKTTSTIEVDIAGNYTVTGTTPQGCVSTQSISVAQELVVNGDFTAGKTNSFTSGYFYQADVAGNNELWDDTANGGTNGYGIGTNGQNYHPNFWGIDHTNNTVGPRNMMIFNGHGDLTVWQQTVNVRPNTDYYFSAWAMSINNAGNYAKLRFEVNGVQVGTIANLTAGPTSAAQANANNYWVRFHSGSLPGGNWNSGSLSGPITIRIVNLEPALSGNDFAIDDISFGTLSPFIVLTSAPGTDNSQVVCENSPIVDISYSAGSGSVGPSVQGLPPGVTSSWNGVTLRFSGTPTTAGTFNYTIETTGSCPNPATATGTIVVKGTPSAGAIAGNQTICNGQDPAPFTSLTAGTGDGIISYRWESNTNLTTPTWTTVTGNSTGATYDPPVLSATTQFRRITIATSGGVACESAPTNKVEVSIAPNNTVDSATPQTVCINTPISTITHTTTGATGIVPENSGVDYNLPNGVTANWKAGIITISGTPTEEGIFNYSIPLAGGCGTAIAMGTITSTNSSYPITRISVVNPPLGAPTPATSTFTVYSAGLTSGNYIVNYSTSGVNEGPDQTIAVTVTTPGEFTFTSLPYTEEGTTLLTINSIQRGTDVCPYFPPNNTVPYGIGCSSEFLEEDGNDIFYVPANISQVTIQLFGDGAGGNTVTKTMEVLPGGGIFVVFSGNDVFATEVPPSEPLTDRLAQAILHTTGPNGRVVFNFTCSSLPPCASQLDNGSQYTDSEGFTVIRFDYVGPCVWQAPDGLDEFEVLVVGGGGGGGYGSAAGGGGAGAVVYQRYTDITMGAGLGLQNAVFPLFVGNQGAGSTTEIQGGNGEGSTFNGPAFTYSGGNTFTGLSAAGGGGGGSSSSNPSIRLGADGASGGGGAASGTAESAGGGGSAGNNGGSGIGETVGSSGAGGGGSAEAGQSGIYNAANQLLIGGNGGNGTERSISGEAIFYGAGGGGTSSGGLVNQAGAGGSPYPGPNGTTLYAGGNATNNGIGQSATTYGSGGGAGRLGGGTGFPGVVYIRFPNYRILPVEYLYFNAKYNQTSRSGDLTWATAKEWENERFEIERAVNTIKEWETIGQKAGAGYSDLPVEYEYADTNLPAAGGNIFYRLKQFDFEGNFTYSETRSIKVEPLPGTSHWIVYPNPTMGDPFNLELLDDGTYNDGPVTVRIILATGQFGVIKSNNLSTLSDQISDWLFEKAAGVYTLEISWEDKKEYHKVILRR